MRSISILQTYFEFTGYIAESISEPGLVFYYAYKNLTGENHTLSQPVNTISYCFIKPIKMWRCEERNNADTSNDD